MPNRSTPEYIPEEKTVADYILEINVVEFVASRMKYFYPGPLHGQNAAFTVLMYSVITAVILCRMRLTTANCWLQRVLWVCPATLLLQSEVN